MTSPAPPTDDQTPALRKSTLFCWECEHSSPFDGDWNRRTRDDQVAYVCPDCETTLLRRDCREDRPDDRSSPKRSPDRRATERSTDSWRRTLRTTIQVWQVSVGVAVSTLAAASGLTVPAGRDSGRDTARSLGTSHR